MHRRREPHRPFLSLALAVVATAALAPPVASAPLLPLLPGEVVGRVNAYEVKPGDTMASIAAYHGVHPVRVRKPSAKVLAEGGLKPGKTVFIDQRRVQPRFQPWVSGIVLNVPQAHVYFLDEGRLVKDYPVAVSRSDWKVPIGQTKVVNMFENPKWVVPKSIQEEMRKNGEEVKTEVPPGPDNPLGTRWIGFFDGTYGFHGTTAPTSIKTYSSHGCVRFFEEHIEDLYRRVKVGTPVRTYYQPVMLGVDRHTVWLSVYPDIYKRDFDYRGAVRALAEQAKVADRLQSDAVDRAIRLKDGILVDVGQPTAPSEPLVEVSPTPGARPSAGPAPEEDVVPLLE